jgi:carbamoyltransferase
MRVFIVKRHLPIITCGPAASDDGTCLGAAYYCWHEVLGRKERFHMKHAFWDPEYPDERLRALAESSGLNVQRCVDNSELVEVAAELIANGLVTGWYQCRGEWGPRALGNRSILANPTIKTMKETVNAKIKRRESFRPFGPSVLREEVATYFDQQLESPFMMHVVKIRPEWRDRLPAITHVDGTGRLQTVDESDRCVVAGCVRREPARTRGNGEMLAQTTDGLGRSAVAADAAQSPVGATT